MHMKEVKMYEKMKKASGSKSYKIRYHSGSYLLPFRKAKLQRL